jgi:hypothetical protein
MEPEVLSYINDYFGVMSLKTVSTTLNFVRYSLMTDYRGQNETPPPCHPGPPTAVPRASRSEIPCGSLDAIAEFRAPLAGTLRVLERQKSSGFGRIWRAGFAWLLNRGLRDVYQGIADGEAGPGPWSRIKAGIAVASNITGSLIASIPVKAPSLDLRCSSAIKCMSMQPLVFSIRPVRTIGTDSPMRLGYVSDTFVNYCGESRHLCC